jgi:hypothetical protein
LDNHKLNKLNLHKDCLELKQVDYNKLRSLLLVYLVTMLLLLKVNLECLASHSLLLRQEVYLDPSLKQQVLYLVQTLPLNLELECSVNLLKPLLLHLEACLVNHNPKLKLVHLYLETLLLLKVLLFSVALLLSYNNQLLPQVNLVLVFSNNNKLLDKLDNLWFLVKT